ncbi:hypothetical protein ACYBSK_33295 [Streptomyces sp. BYX5S]
MNEFIMSTAPEAREYLLEVVEEMTDTFNISSSEAVARINSEWGHLSFEEWPDLIEHELPEHWAYRIYYGDVPYWDPSEDRRKWVPKDAPPRGSRYWTLK